MVWLASQPRQVCQSFVFSCDLRKIKRTDVAPSMCEVMDTVQVLGAWHSNWARGTSAMLRYCSHNRHMHITPHKWHNQRLTAIEL